MKERLENLERLALVSLDHYNLLFNASLVASSSGTEKKIRNQTPRFIILRFMAINAEDAKLYI